MVAKAYRIGLGATVLARGLASTGHLDGIGVYTREILHTLEKSDDAIKVAPVVFGSAVAGIDGFSKKNFPLSFEMSSGLSYLSGFNTPGAADVERSFDLFHAPDHCIPRLRKIPLVASIMDVITLTKPDYVKSSLRSLKSAVFSRLAKKAQHIITISDYSAHEIEQVLGIARERITVTPLGVNKRYFDRVATPLRESVLTRYSLPRPYFLAVGTLQTRKNVDRILDAYEHLPTDIINSVDLVVAGRARPDMASLMERLGSSRTRGNVKWIQYVPDDDLPALLQSATALVFPSLYEGFGLPVIEAFASRTPVITSNTTSLPEVAGDAAILVNPLSVEEISEGMQRVVESPEAMLALAARGYARASEFTWDRTAALTAHVYRSILS
jgi:glycosyltransferase involved in cell wall biosynthesis